MSIPNGYLEVAADWAGSAAWCKSSSPAFVRGRLVKQSEWGTFNPNTILTTYPRWVFYGGPLPTKEVAEQWIYTLYFWSQANGLVWIPDPKKPTPCVVPPQEIQWPVQKPINWNNIFRWEWVRETQPPDVFAKQNDNKWHLMPKGSP